MTQKINKKFVSTTVKHKFNLNEKNENKLFIQCLSLIPWVQLPHIFFSYWWSFVALLHEGSHPSKRYSYHKTEHCYESSLCKASKFSNRLYWDVNLKFGFPIASLGYHLIYLPCYANLLCCMAVFVYLLYDLHDLLV